MSGPNSLTCKHGLGFINLWLASENITVLDCFWVSLNSSTSIKTISITAAITGHCRHLPLFQGAPSSLLLILYLLCCMLPLNLEGNSLTQHPPNISSTLTSPKPFTWRSSCLKLKSTNRKPMVGKLTNYKVGGLHPPLTAWGPNRNGTTKDPRKGSSATNSLGWSSDWSDHQLNSNFPENNNKARFETYKKPQESNVAILNPKVLHVFSVLTSIGDFPLSHFIPKVYIPHMSN